MNYLQNMDEKIIQKIYFHGKCILGKIILIACTGTMFTSHYSKISLYGLSSIPSQAAYG